MKRVRGERTRTLFCLDARTQESLKESDTHTGQRQTDTGKQQQRLTGNLSAHVTDPTQDTGEHLTNGVDQRSNGHSSFRQISPFLIFEFQ